MTMPPPTAYRETVRWPAWFHLVMACGAGISISGFLALLVRGGAHLLLVVPGLTAASLLFVWWRLRRLEIAFGPDGAAFGFGTLRRRVPASRILHAAVEAFPFRRYFGYGYRIGWKPRDRAYALAWPRGVRLEFLDEGGRRWSVHLSSRDPERAVRALEITPRVG